MVLRKVRQKNYQLIDNYQNVLFYATNSYLFGKKIVALAAKHILTVHANSVNHAITSDQL